MHNHDASVASLRRLFAFGGTPFGFPLESPFTFTGIPTLCGQMKKTAFRKHRSTSHYQSVCGECLPITR